MVFGLRSLRVKATNKNVNFHTHLASCDITLRTPIANYSFRFFFLVYAIQAFTQTVDFGANPTLIRITWTVAFWIIIVWITSFQLVLATCENLNFIRQLNFFQQILGNHLDFLINWWCFKSLLVKTFRDCWYKIWCFL